MITPMEFTRYLTPRLAVTFSVFDGTATSYFIKARHPDGREMMVALGARDFEKLPRSALEDAAPDQRDALVIDWCVATLREQNGVEISLAELREMLVGGGGT